MKSKIIIALGIALAIALFFLFQKPKVVVETVTTTKIEQIPHEVSLPKLQPKEVTLKTIKVPMYLKDSVTKRVVDTIYKEVETKKHSYTKKFDKGVLNSTIYADSVYQYDVDFKFYEEKRMISTKETIVRNDVYLGSTITLNPNKSVLNQSVNVFYSHRGKFMIGTGLGYDNNTKQIFLPITFAIKL